MIKDVVSYKQIFDRKLLAMDTVFQSNAVIRNTQLQIQKNKNSKLNLGVEGGRN